MRDVPALQRYLQAELPRRGWSIPEFARRVPGLSQSNAYRIVNDGFDNVEFETFEAIATTLSMTPADLASAIGKGAPEEHPQRATAHALLRGVADEDLGAVERVLRSFAIQPLNRGRANRVRDGRDNRRTAAAREIEAAAQNQASTDPDSKITQAFRWVRGGHVSSVGHVERKLALGARIT